MGVYINIDVKEIRHGAVAVLNIDDVAFFVATKDIIAVPDHGDLIDRDKLRMDMRLNDIDGYLSDYDLLDLAPVVIPAERSEE